MRPVRSLIPKSWLKLASLIHTLSLQRRQARRHREIFVYRFYTGSCSSSRAARLVGGARRLYVVLNKGCIDGSMRSRLWSAACWIG